jgi:sec-independent protein translocase protein TatA
MMVMFGLSAQHLIFFAIVALLLFGGKGKISELMGDVAKGIKSFKKGMADDDGVGTPSVNATLPLESRGVTIDAKDKEKIS